VPYFVREPIALFRIEHQFFASDLGLARSVIFDLLRTGQLCAPALHNAAAVAAHLPEPCQVREM
jgi:hypothetical protein